MGWLKIKNISNGFLDKCVNLEHLDMNTCG
jgi:hypothetical protein